METALMDDILKMVKTLKRQAPNYPVHAVGQAGTVMIEASQLLNLAMELKYVKRNGERPAFAGISNEKVIALEMKKAALRTAAAAIRYLENLEA